jgi:hypothetical protein
VYHGRREEFSTMTEGPTISLLSYDPEYDVIPHAIFWRPLNYFTITFREDEDGLDIFKGASFTIGNEISFALRSYRGHPDFTVTLYLPHTVESPKEISATIDLVVQVMVIPRTAVAWRREQPFKYGALEKPRDDRFREPEARILALKIAAQRPNQRASTTYLKSQVPKYIDLSHEDLAPSPSRPNERVWQQVMGNVVSHHKTRSGPFLQGYAVRTDDGLRVTKKGVDYLKSMGYFVPA